MDDRKTSKFTVNEESFWKIAEFNHRDPLKNQKTKIFNKVYVQIKERERMKMMEVFSLIATMLRKLFRCKINEK